MLHCCKPTLKYVKPRKTFRKPLHFTFNYYTIPLFLQFNLTVQCAMEFLEQIQYNIPQDLSKEVRRVWCSKFHIININVFMDSVLILFYKHTRVFLFVCQNLQKYLTIIMNLTSNEMKTYNSYGNILMDVTEKFASALVQENKPISISLHTFGIKPVSKFSNTTPISLSVHLHESNFDFFYF